MNCVLEARNLHLLRGGREIFAVENFGLVKGGVLALIGPNGAGKTSLLLTLALLERPSGGTLLFSGEKVTPGRLISLRRRMAVVFQEPLLLDTTVEKNIAVGLKIRKVPDKEARQRTALWMERLDIGHLALRRARHLSGGEAQRTSLARALVLEPEVLFLDEPFAALDFPTRNALLNDLGAILRDTEVSTLFVTHDYTEIPFLTANVAVMFKGRIIKSGLLREVFGAEIQRRENLVPWGAEQAELNA